MDRWSYLPEELLLLIFKFLKDPDLVSASSTCKKWRRVYHDPCLWRSRTFEFAGYCRSQSERLQMLSKYVDTMGHFLQHIRFVCPSPNLLTAYSVAQCIETLLTGLTGLREGKKTIQSFEMSKLYFDETWGCFRSSKCLLIDSIATFIEAQTNLRIFDISDAFMSPPFAYRIMKALAKSRSIRTLEALDVLNYYSLQATTRVIGSQLLSVCKRCWNLKELSLNYAYLYAVKIVELCELLEDTLERLTVHLTVFDHARDWDIISSDSWRFASKLCPRLQVAFHMEDWPRNPPIYLVPGMPLVQLAITGGQCRYSSLTFGDKTNMTLDHLARYFSTTLRSASFVADSYTSSPCQQEALARFFVKCRNIRTLLFSDTLVTPELMTRVKADLSDTCRGICVVKT